MLKSVFVSLYITLLHVGAIFAFYDIIQFGVSFSNIGLIVASLPGALFFDYLLLLQSRARTRRHLNFISTIKFAGLLMVISEVLGEGLVLDPSIVLAAVGFFGWLLYDYWFSSYGQRDQSIVKVGSLLPELTFKSLDGSEFSTQSLTGKPALLIFYRGNWCPLCMAQIQEVAAQYKTLADKGVQILLISPQPHGHTQKLAQKFDLPFIYLTDSKGKSARRLKIFAKNGLPLGMQIFGYDSDTVMPTVIITDASGEIIFADLTDNYRVRPEPETFIKALQGSGG
ncbi:MAG: peroxiredoxin family protein [Kangiellaceae bacterium]|nr:peroxiredoxin family protein [Kangiellaceae bacterium]MCW9000779.1 peroxiredoxin family protein [Kangiellaceae bacterium]